jgi:hypothetical protein
MTKPLDWTPEQLVAVIFGCLEHDCVRVCRTAMCLFWRPTDEQIVRIRDTPPFHGTPEEQMDQLAASRFPDFRKEDVFSGRNVWSLAWFGIGRKDQLALTRIMAKEVGPGGMMATHQGSEYREWNPIKHGTRGAGGRDGCESVNIVHDGGRRASGLAETPRTPGVSGRVAGAAG